jgi:eukaryotic-like serine/threonine-protein kinase
VPIAIGQKLGRYRIEEEIGAGGMGVVYRAFDEKLERDVAIKVLAPGTLDDPAARKKFRNEALVLSRLNHPSIQTIHDFDTIEGHDLLVGELVPGTSVDVRLRAGALPEKEVVRLGMQMAQGLAAAHAEGVLHRDLKPANLRVTPDGRLKILDFGLATVSRDAVVSLSRETGSLADVPTGVSGTLPYMAPEQLLGDAMDERSDLYSAGAALFEMATGRMPFTDVLVPKLTNAILHEEPPSPRAVAPKLSGDLERIILKCLEKDPELRYQAAKELAADLRRREAVSSRADSALKTPVPKRRPRWVYAALIVGALAIVTVGVMAVSWVRARRNATGPLVLRWEQLTNFNDSAQVPVLSPDGKILAFIRGEGDIGGSATRGEMWIKVLPASDPLQVTNDKYRKQTPAFSRDGSRLYFTRVEERFAWNTYAVGLLGGQQPQPFLKNATGLSWISDDRLLFSEIDQGVHMGLMTSNISRADERTVYMPKPESGMVHRSALSPDGKWALLVEMDGTGWMPCRLVPFDGSSEGREVGPPSACTWAQWSPDGKWMYFTAEAPGSGFHVWRQTFPKGPAEQLTPSGATEEEGLAVAPDGKSLFTSAGTRESSIWLHDAEGDHQLTSEGYDYLPTVSPDRKKIYYVRRIPGSRSYVSGELWSADVATATSERVLPGIVLSHYSISPDGRRVVFAMAEGEPRSGIWMADLDQTQGPRQLTHGKEFRVFFAGNDYVVYQTPETKSHLARIRVQDGAMEEVNSAPILHLVTVSPDGNWATVVFAQEGHGDRVTSVKMQPLHGGDPIPVCDKCMIGFGPSRSLAPVVAWSPDGKFQYLSLRYFGMQLPQTLVFPLKSGKPTALNSINLGSEEQIAKLNGARMINREDVFPGPSPDVYAFTLRGAKSNLFRIYLQ